MTPNENGAIVNFLDIKKKHLEETPKEEIKQVVSSSSNLSDEEKKLEIKSKIASAKMNGANEIEAFRKAVDEFKDKVKDMALFSDCAEVAEQMFITEILDTVVEPIFKGHNPYGVPEGLCKIIRKDIFKQLIKKYDGGK